MDTDVVLLVVLQVVELTNSGVSCDGLAIATIVGNSGDYILSSISEIVPRNNHVGRKIFIQAMLDVVVLCQNRTEQCIGCRQIVVTATTGECHPCGDCHKE